MSAALLPEPTYHLASNGRLMKTDGDIDCTGKQLTIYTADQMRDYGDRRAAAERERCLGRAAMYAPYNHGLREAIRKGEKS